MRGTQDEDRTELTKEESRAVRERSLRLLGSLMRPVRGSIVVLAIQLVIATAARTAGPTLIGVGIDLGLPALLGKPADPVPLIVIVVGYLAISIVGALLVAAYTVRTARTSQEMLVDLRERVFRHTQRLSMEFHERYTSGRIISRQTSDLDTLRELLSGGISSLVQGVLSMAFTAVALFLQDWASGLVLLVYLVPLFFLARWFQRRSVLRFRQQRTASARVIVKFVETMTGIRAVKGFRVEPRNDAQFGGLVEDLRSANEATMRLFGTFDPGLKLIGNVAMATVLVVGALRVFDGALDVGVLLAAILYVRQFYAPAEELAMFYNSYQSAAAALEKISGVLEEDPTVPEPAQPVALAEPAGHLRFERVRFSYREGVEVLPAFDLDIPAGQTIALVGTTGAGKSTIAKLVSRFYDPSTGRVTLDGVDLRDLADVDLRRAIVMVTQEAYLFSGSVAENIALGKPEATLAEIEAAAVAVGADAFIRALPDGYDTDVNKRGGRVSAGQRQLISFARAFLADPAVIILDEATASLDIPGERMVQEALTTLLADRTAIIIAHRLSTVAIADRVLVMEHGRIVEDGTPDALVAGDGRFARLHRAWLDSLV